MTDIRAHTAELDAIRFREIYGVFVLNADEVEFRAGSMSGPVCLVSDPDRRGLLGSVLCRLLSPKAPGSRPWNDPEIEILNEIIPQLADAGIIENVSEAKLSSEEVVARPRLSAADKARIAMVGDGVLGTAIRSLMVDMPCGSMTTIQSSSVRRSGNETTARGVGWAYPHVDHAHHTRARPQSHAQWLEAIKDHDWVIAAQDCFEPEELTALGKAAWELSLPWSLVCFDGYEGWIGPTFAPGHTGCFSCFRRRLFAGQAEPKHVFADPGVKVHRMPSPWSAGLETGAWVSLIASIFALEVVAAMEGRSFTFNSFVVIHRLNLTFQRESVLRLPAARTALREAPRRRRTSSPIC
jgi:bacteriocin biosynthesis cyclodehydratase domain-containing protein